ncbi:MAG: sugar phosphate isomerase/epimerase [Verrucomicrobia bacterium]|nr:sugar phosphate isomerase/epimerase [Verrucomicrobiota bacterium]MBU1735206.1 sugar phosphate isomerase/epimerase [Verrucomicrobiota bacterium]MBU1857508.1 sugar phosphate isomerase/epimerase [Verrucomicrobiota bacterium]
MKPISLQLYTLREEAKTDFVGVLKRVAAIGYKGVEPAGLHEIEPKEFKRIVKDLGMVISSTHSPWARADNLPETIAVLGELGVTSIAAGFGENEFKDLNAIKATAEMVEKMDQTLRAAGITMAIHNHWWEFEKLDGRLKFEIFAELAPNVRFEMDTYWASNFGANDSVKLVKKYAGRCPLLHIKDGPLVKDQPLLAVGSGKMDIPAVVKAAGKATQWLVVEQDTSATDMFACVESSYKYLTGNGLAEGNR